MFEKIYLVAWIIVCCWLLFEGYASDAVFFALAGFWAETNEVLRLRRRLEELEKKEII